MTDRIWIGIFDSNVILINNFRAKLHAEGNTLHISTPKRVVFRLNIKHIIIPTSNHHAYFAQFDWLEKRFYTSIKSMSRNLRTIFLPPTPKIIMNELNFLWILSMCKLRRITHKLTINPSGFSQFVSDSLEFTPR